MSEPGTHKPVRTTWSFFMLIFSAHPSSPILPAAVFSRFRPQGVPHPPHPSLRPQTLVAFGYCSTVVPFSSLHRHFSTSHKNTSRIRNLFYSECSPVTRNSARNLLVYPGTRKPGMPINGGLCRSDSAHRGKGREEKRLLQLRIYLHVKFMTLTRTLGPPPRPAQQRPDPDSQPQNQHPR